MTISLSIRNPSETPSKSSTANLAYRYRPLLADAQLPDGQQTFPYRVVEELLVTRPESGTPLFSSSVVSAMACGC